MHAKTLENLINVEKLASITRAALEQFQEIKFRGNEVSGKEVRKQYWEDAEEAYKLLTLTQRKPSPLEDNVKEIRRILDAGF